MSNLGLEIALNQLGIPFDRTKVGDRYVMERLHEKNWYIGGESSGHIIWLNSTTTGDGIVGALQVLAVMIKQGKSLQDLLQGYHSCPQVLINIALKDKLTALQLEAVQEEAKKMTAQLKDKGRVLVRPSGTEPLLRVMVEAHEEKDANTYAKALAENIQTRMTQEELA